MGMCLQILNHFSVQVSEMIRSFDEKDELYREAQDLVSGRVGAVNESRTASIAVDSRFERLLFMKVFYDLVFKLFRKIT